MKFSNDLTEAQLERLAILSEELGEAQQAIGKIMRHGYHSWNPYVVGTTTNKDDLEKELGDVRFAINLLRDAGDVSAVSIIVRMREKAKKIAPYLHHQEVGEQGSPQSDKLRDVLQRPLASYLTKTYDFSTESDRLKAMEMGIELVDGFAAALGEPKGQWLHLKRPIPETR